MHFLQADVDDKPAAEAILRGLKKRKETTGKVPFLIHTVRPYMRLLSGSADNIM
jgi:hypothetical protein